MIGSFSYGGSAGFPRCFTVAICLELHGYQVYSEQVSKQFREGEAWGN